MFSKELENLIEASLADGILDDNEKAALVKRAQSEGVDLSELEIYINSILQKRAQIKSTKEDAREEERAARLLKEKGRLCPYCSTPIPPLAETCPACGQLIMTAAVNEKIEKSIEKIKNDFSIASGINVNQAGGKDKVRGHVASIKAELMDLRLKYSTVDKVKVFAQNMDENIAGLEKKIKNSNKMMLIIIIVLAVVLIVCITIGIIFGPKQEDRSTKEAPISSLFNSKSSDANIHEKIDIQYKQLANKIDSLRTIGGDAEFNEIRNLSWEPLTSNPNASEYSKDATDDEKYEGAKKKAFELKRAQALGY